MRFAILAAAAAALLGLGAAEAQTAIDGNVGFTYFANDDDTTAVTLRGGGNVIPYVGVEAEGSFGIDGDIDTQWGAFGKLILPMEVSELFVRLGWADADGSGVAYGVGGQYMLDDMNGFRFDYTHYEADDDLNAISFVYVRRLGWTGG